MTPWIHSKTQGKRVLRRWHISGAPLLRYWHTPGAPLTTIQDACGDALKCNVLVLGTVRGTFTLTTPSQQRNTMVQFHTKPKSQKKSTEVPEELCNSKCHTGKYIVIQRIHILIGGSIQNCDQGRSGWMPISEHQCSNIGIRPEHP